MKLLRKLNRLRLSSHSGRTVKKFIIIAAVAVGVFVVGVIVLIILLVSWLFNNGSEHAQHASNVITQQTQSLAAPLNLASYIQNGQVDTVQLEQAFAAVPAPLQGLWISQLESQINEMRAQAGLTNENLQMLEVLLASFRQMSQ